MRANQGMRQPQLGGVRSQPLRAVTLHEPSTHRTYWRVGAWYPWVCATCHPPARVTGSVEWRTSDRNLIGRASRPSQGDD